MEAGLCNNVSLSTMSLSLSFPSTLTLYLDPVSTLHPFLRNHSVYLLQYTVPLSLSPDRQSPPHSVETLFLSLWLVSPCVATQFKLNCLFFVISPSLYRLKDSDTTWLYGPLYKANIDEFDLARFGAQTVPGGTKIPTTPTTENGLKPALKHKTASELFKADTLFHVQSDLKLDRKIEPKSKARQTAVYKQHRQPKLRFNDSVEQCVSVDTDALSADELDEDDEEDAGLLMRISVKRPARSIVRIHPTKLKAENMIGMQIEDDSDDEEEPSRPPQGNPYTGSETTYVRPTKEDGVDADDDDEAAIAEVSYTRSSANTEASPAGGAPSARSLSPSSHPESEKNGGLGQRAYELVNNVRDIVHWASSLVYNSSAF